MTNDYTYMMEILGRDPEEPLSPQELCFFTLAKCRAIQHVAHDGLHFKDENTLINAIKQEQNALNTWPGIEFEEVSGFDIVMMTNLWRSAILIMSIVNGE